jgi:prepilin-type N-terminal cleavage/methylation domain-containing protein
MTIPATIWMNGARIFLSASRSRSAANRPTRVSVLRSSLAFTLIELLVVISIIGILAALIIPLSGVATTKMRISRTKAELNQLVTAIESYKVETGSYPPDNTNLVLSTTSAFLYRSNAAMNSLFYELTGAIFTNGLYRTLVEGEEIKPSALQTYFGLSGIQNAARNKHDIDYKGFSIRASQYAELEKPEDIEILTVPVPGPYEIIGRKNKRINPWFYDSSTTNRHNRNGFDLWAEIKTGGTNITVIGNWRN